MNLADVQFEEGLPSATLFNTVTKNLVILDDLMAETDERVTTLSFKKVITGTRPVSLREPVPREQGEFHHQSVLSIHGRVQ